MCKNTNIFLKITDKFNFNLIKIYELFKSISIKTDFMNKIINAIKYNVLIIYLKFK